MILASRMESNGLPGRIQVSQQTAYLLIDAGKGSWITPREDVIEAKGKGE
jgi:class 3 adenylate cyclase